MSGPNLPSPVPAPRAPLEALRHGLEHAGTEAARGALGETVREFLEATDTASREALRRTAFRVFGTPGHHYLLAVRSAVAADPDGAPLGAPVALVRDLLVERKIVPGWFSTSSLTSRLSPLVGAGYLCRPDVGRCALTVDGTPIADFLAAIAARPDGAALLDAKLLPKFRVRVLETLQREGAPVTFSGLCSAVGSPNVRTAIYPLWKGGMIERVGEPERYTLTARAKSALAARPLLAELFGAGG